MTPWLTLKEAAYAKASRATWRREAKAGRLLVPPLMMLAVARELRDALAEARR